MTILADQMPRQRATDRRLGLSIWRGAQPSAEPIFHNGGGGASAMLGLREMEQGRSACGIVR